MSSTKTKMANLQGRVYDPASHPAGLILNRIRTGLDGFIGVLDKKILAAGNNEVTVGFDSVGQPKAIDSLITPFDVGSDGPE